MWPCLKDLVKFASGVAPLPFLLKPPILMRLAAAYIITMHQKAVHCKSFGNPLASLPLNKDCRYVCDIYHKLINNDLICGLCKTISWLKYR